MENMYAVLQELCRTKNITITDMCRAAGVPRSSVGNLATGSTRSLSAKNVQKLAAYFNVSTDYLLGNTQKETPSVEQNGGLEDELFAFYGEVKPLFDERDIEDLKIFIKAKADYKRKMLDDKSRKDKTEPDR